MNNLIFNTVASELKTSMYAQASDSSLQVLQIDNDGSLKTVISNSSLTVAVANSITIANDSLTVAVSNPITIANSSISVNIIGNTFTSSSVLNTAVNGTGTILNNTDISTLRTASFLVYNLGANTLTVSLQVSPTTNEADYITDPSYSNFAVLGGGKQIITVSRFARYTRLIYTLGGTTATFSVYFNAQS